MNEYGMAVTTTLSMEDAEVVVRDALAAEGFGVLTEIDVAAVLKKKIGVERAAYKILGACNPEFANQALNHDEAIGLLLPCNVVLSESEGGTVVNAVDPVALLSLAGDDPNMALLADAVKVGLRRVLSSLRKRRATRKSERGRPAWPADDAQ